MAQLLRTYRPLDEDEDDAPPPYEATATNTITATTATTAAAGATQYPVLDTSHLSHNSNALQDDGTMSMPPPPIDYYPPMTTTAIPTPASTVTAAHTSYPVLAGSASYTAYPTAPLQPQAYPVMPILNANSSYTMPYSTSPGAQLLQHQPSAPWAVMEASPGTQSAASQPYTPHAIPVEPAILDDNDDTNKIGSSQSLERNLIDLDDGANAENVSLRSVSLPTPSSSPPPTVSASISVPAVSLVTNYRCRRCGAILESETAVCKRLHTLTLNLAENQVQHATRADLEGRSRDYGGLGSSSSSPTQAGTTWTSIERGSSHGSNNSPPLDHSYVGGESAAAYSNNPSQASPENNYGTNATYFRRSRSVQTPVTALKKLWRDAKKEISYRQSVNSRQPEIVAPSPLISVHGGTGYDDGTGGTEASLGRSNTLADIQTPAYNPSYTGHQLLQHSDEQLSAHIPLQPQPWLAPSTAPPRDPSWE